MIKIEPNAIVNGELWNYHVTRDGRVFSLNYNHTGEVKELKLCNNGRGYSMVLLSHNGTKKFVQVARLVALAYIPNPNNKPEVDHINRIRTDNRVENLRWVTKSENALNRDKYKRPNYPKNYKKSKPVRCIETGAIYPSGSEVQRQLGFLQGDISRCCNGIRKTCGGFHWEYVE